MPSLVLSSRGNKYAQHLVQSEQVIFFIGLPAEVLSVSANRAKQVVYLTSISQS